jgi:hypothetical protein
MSDSAEEWEESDFKQEISYKEHEELTRDIMNHKKMFGEDSVRTRSQMKTHRFIF